VLAQSRGISDRYHAHFARWNACGFLITMWQELPLPDMADLQTANANVGSILSQF
jgi:hypothetical protein